MSDLPVPVRPTLPAVLEGEEVEVTIRWRGNEWSTTGFFREAALSEFTDNVKVGRAYVPVSGRRRFSLTLVDPTTGFVAAPKRLVAGDE